MPRLGIVTTQTVRHHSSFSRSGSCGLVKWCYTVAQIISLPYLSGDADGIVITNDATHVRELCDDELPQLHIRAFEPHLAQLVTSWSKLVNYTQAMPWTRWLSYAAMFKWQCFKLVEYAVIIFTDVDVDFFLSTSGMPPPIASARGRQLQKTLTDDLNLFVNNGSLELLASSDVHSPINTGVMVLKPSEVVYERGLRVLQRARFDRALGFDMIGRPQHALSHLKQSEYWPYLERTRMLTQNDWNFVGGHACQGLFVHVFLAMSRRTALTFAYPKLFLKASERRRRHSGFVKLMHFAGGLKPWRAGALATCPPFFAFIRNIMPSCCSPSQRNVSIRAHCWGMLIDKQRCLRPGLDTKECLRCRTHHMRYTGRSCAAPVHRCDGEVYYLL